MASRSKRPDGAGTIRERGGRFEVRIRHGEARPSLGTYATRADAEGVLRAVLEGRQGEAEAGTLGAYAVAWLRRRDLAGYRTARNDASRWASHVEASALAALELHAVTARDVADHLEVVAAGGVARETVRHVRTLLGALYRDAVRRGDVVASPVAGVPLPRRGRAAREWTYLSADEVEAVTAERPWVPRRYGHPVQDAQDAVRLAIFTGLRQGELFGLEWDDVQGLEGERPMMTIRRSWRGATKSGRVRTVPLLPMAADVLRRLPRRGPTVLSTPLGRPYARGYDAGWDRGLRERLGVTRAVTWHDLRHTCASHLVSGSWGRAWRLEEVCAYLGHTDIRVTQRYAHLSPDALIATAAATNCVQAGGRTMAAKHWRTLQDSNLRPSAPEASPTGGEMTELSGAMRPRCVQLAERLLEAVERGDRVHLIARAVDLADAVLDAAAVAHHAPHATPRNRSRITIV